MRLTSPAPYAAAPAAPTVAPEPPRLTPAGLPWRQRPASPGEASPAAAGAPTTAPSTPGAPPVWTPVAAGEPTAGDAIPTRPPDQTRSLMSSYRSGTLRGRTEAARLTEPTEPAGETPQWAEPPTGPLNTEPVGTAETAAAPTTDPRTTEEEG